LLNQSYAFVVSRNFAETANALRERLVTGAGFERREVSEFVTAATSEQARLDLDGHAGWVFVRPVTIALPEKPDLKGLPKPVRSKLSWDARLNTLTISASLTADEGEALKASVTSEAAVLAIEQAAEASRTSAIEFSRPLRSLGSASRYRNSPGACTGRCSFSMTPNCLSIRGTSRPTLRHPVSMM
jgi:type III restriction enzyme